MCPHYFEEQALQLQPPLALQLQPSFLEASLFSRAQPGPSHYCSRKETENIWIHRSPATTALRFIRIVSPIGFLSQGLTSASNQFKLIWGETD
jgi:hypothetical protein